MVNGAVCAQAQHAIIALSQNRTMSLLYETACSSERFLETGSDVQSTSAVADRMPNGNFVARFPDHTWTGPFAPETLASASALLEEGRVLFFPNLPFSIEDSERLFLSPSVS